MKRIILLVVHTLIWGTLIINGQNKSIDSLQELLINHTANDTFKINLLNNIAYKLYYIDGEKSLAYAKRAENLADSLNYDKGLAESFRVIGIYYKVRGNYSIALKHYMHSLKISEKIGDKFAIAKVLGNIGILYKEQDKLDKAFEYTRMSLKINKEINYGIGIGSNLTNLGLLYYKSEDYDSALIFQLKALKVYELNHFSLGIANSYLNIGEVYFAKADYSKSYDYYKKALVLAKNIDYYYGYSDALLSIGAINLKIHQYAEALDYTLQSMKIANRHNFLDLKIMIYKQLSDIYAKTKNYQKAYENYVFYKTLNDSVFNIKNLSKIADLEYQYKYEQKKHADELLQQKKDAERALEAKRQKMIRNAFVFGFLVMFAFVLIILYGFLQKRKANRILSTQKKEIELKNDELHLQNEKIGKMNATLDKQKDELESLNLSLEEKVKIRTAELEKALKKAEESKNLISAFFENMSHEIRTPMNAISGFAQLLAGQGHLDKQIEHYTDVIVNNVDDLIEFLDNIMDASKLHSGQYQFVESVFDLNEVFYSVYDKLINKRNLKADSVDCNLYIPVNHEFLIFSDPNAFKYIINNLFENALKYTEEGEIQIGYRINEKNANILLAGKKFKVCSEDFDLELEIFVKDSGMGIDENEQKFIFDFFRKAEKGKVKLYRGTGLGLAIVDKLIHKLGAKIEIQSKVNSGTHIFLRIPLKEFV
jgi:signal transduction histidine kinase